MAVYNIPGAYLNTDMGKIVTVKFRGILTKLISLASLEVYHKYVALENSDIFYM